MDAYLDEPAKVQLEHRQLSRTTVTPWLVAAGMVAAMLVYLWLAGRVGWCACGVPTLFVSEPAGSHTSQHLLDWYSFSHLLHGIIFFWVLRLVGPRLPLAWMLAVAVGVEAGWEMLENSPIIIDRYRTATAALGYQGDSMVNSMGDLACCVAGFFAARRLGWRWSIGLFIAVELVMLWAIRDNLTLNVVMLLWPIEAIRQWQMGA